MPEYSEVRLTGEYINEVNNHKTIVEVEYLPTNRLKLVEEIDVIGTNLAAQTRGKEIKLLFDNQPVVINLGMSGGFRQYARKLDDSVLRWKHGHIRFKLSDGTYFVWHDVRRFGKSIGLDWGKNRGPDIFDEEDEFRNNILNNIDHRDFTKPAHEALMNQKWFNGIGNYLRAEILGKWDVNPFQPIKNIISNQFLDHLIQQVKDSYQLGGGELYTWKNESKKLDNQLSWDSWMRYYGFGAKIKDKNKRTFWFDPKWEHIYSKKV